MRAEAPAEAAIQDVVGHFKEPAVPLKRLWRSQQIPHRLAVLNYLGAQADRDPQLLRAMAPVLLGAANVGDLQAKEASFGLLAKIQHPELLHLAMQQLRDTDPAARVLGLQYLPRVADSRLTPVVFPLLDDPDPRVVVMAASALRRWTGQDFGIRLSHALPQFVPIDGKEVGSADADAIKRGVERWKEWWAAHQSDYPTQANVKPKPRVSWRLATSDFALRDLNGKEVKLSQFKGKLVLLNFWDTVTPACATLATNLIEVQRRLADLVVVLGISLDTTAPERSHEHEHAHEHGGKPDVEPDLAQIREGLVRAVQSSGINYRVLIDPTGAIGRRFSAEELPTNLLIDAEGFVRRRFVGLRSADAFTAMLNEIDPSKVASH